MKMFRNSNKITNKVIALLLVITTAAALCGWSGSPVTAGETGSSEVISSSSQSSDPESSNASDQDGSGENPDGSDSSGISTETDSSQENTAHTGSETDSSQENTADTESESGNSQENVADTGSETGNSTDSAAETNGSTDGSSVTDSSSTDSSVTDSSSSDESAGNGILTANLYKITVKYTAASKLVLYTGYKLPEITSVDFKLYAPDGTEITDILIKKAIWQKKNGSGWDEVEVPASEIVSSDSVYALRFEMEFSSTYTLPTGAAYVYDSETIGAKRSTSQKTEARFTMNQQTLPTDDVVCVISGTGYASLEDALNASKDNDTIIMCGSKDQQYSFGNFCQLRHNLTLDLNGRDVIINHTYSSGEDIQTNIGDSGCYIEFKVINSDKSSGGFTINTLVNVLGDCVFDFMDLPFNTTGGFKFTEDAAKTKELIDNSGTVIFSSGCISNANDFAEKYPGLMCCITGAKAGMGSETILYQAQSLGQLSEPAEWKLMESNNPVASIDRTSTSGTTETFSFADLDTAIAEAKEGETITLLADCSVNKSTILTKSFTIDNQNTYNLTIGSENPVNKPLFRIASGAALTLKGTGGLKSYSDIELNGTLSCEGKQRGESSSISVVMGSNAQLNLSDGYVYRLDSFVYQEGDYEQLFSLTAKVGAKVIVGTNDLFNYEYMTSIEGYGVWVNLADGKHVVQVQSMLSGTETSAKGMDVTGGAEVYQAVGTRLTAPSVTGYKFLGWYRGYSKNSDGERVGSGLTYYCYPSEDMTLTAVYKAEGTCKLTVDASKYTVTNDTLYPGPEREGIDTFVYNLPAVITLTFTDPDKTFMYWVNGSDMIVSRSAEYRFYIANNTSLRAVCRESSEQQSALVVFKSDYGQIMAAKRYTSADEITIPFGPSKSGYTFAYWNMTAEQIKEKIAEGNGETIEVTPVYTENQETYTVTVKYVDPEGNTLRDDSTFTKKTSVVCKITVPEIEGKTFSYWSDALPTDTNGKILAYHKQYKAYSQSDMILYAVYGAESTPQVAVNITSLSRSTTDDPDYHYKLTFIANYDVPDNMTVTGCGFVATRNSNCATEDTLQLDQDEISNFAFSLTVNYAVMAENIRLQTIGTRVYVRAYVQVKSSDSNEVTTYYSDIMKARYDTRYDNSSSEEG